MRPNGYALPRLPPRTGEYGLTTPALGTLPRWDLSNVYPNLESNKFREAVSDLRRQVDQLDIYLDDNRVSRGTLDKPRTSNNSAKLLIDGFIERANSTVRLFATLDSFVASYVTTDSFNTTAKRLESDLEMVEVRLRKQEVRFKG